MGRGLSSEQDLSFILMDCQTLWQMCLFYHLLAGSKSSSISASWKAWFMGRFGLYGSRVAIRARSQLHIDGLPNPLANVPVLLSTCGVQEQLDLSIVEGLIYGQVRSVWVEGCHQSKFSAS